MVGVSLVTFFAKKVTFSTEFLVFNRQFSTPRVEKARVLSFPQGCPQTVQSNSRPVFAAVITVRGVFHQTNSPYYCYYQS
jgi:hypothetical protein